MTDYICVKPRKSAGAELGEKIGKETFSGGRVTPLSSTHLRVCPESVKALSSWILTSIKHLLKYEGSFMSWALSLSISSQVPPTTSSLLPFLLPCDLSVSYLGENMNHSFNPPFICNMQNICNVNFIVLHKEGTRKQFKKRSLPFRVHKQISMGHTDHGVKCQLGPLSQREWRSKPHLSFFLILCKNSIL